MAFLSSRLLRSIKPPSFGNLIASFKSLHLVSKLHQEIKPLDTFATTNLNSRKTGHDCQSIIRKVNDTVSSPEGHGRLFAVVHLCGKQFKVTSGDIIIVEGYWPPTISDRIHLEKVLLVGANSFTLFGRPVLEKGLVDVQATIIEKTLSHTKTHFKKKRRKQYTRINFQRSPHTMIRINSIDIVGKVNEALKGTDPVNIF